MRPLLVRRARVLPQIDMAGGLTHRTTLRILLSSFAAWACWVSFLGLQGNSRKPGPQRYSQPGVPAGLNGNWSVARTVPASGPVRVFLSDSGFDQRLVSL